MANGAQEVGWTDYRDALVCAEIQQVPVARNDQVGPAFDSAGDDMVIVGVVGDSLGYGSGLEDFGFLDDGP